MKREHFYTKDLHFAAYLLLKGYEPELKLPYPNARKVFFEYPGAEFPLLRDLRTKFEGDKTIAVNLIDYVQAMRELGSRINFFKRETLKKEAYQDGHINERPNKYQP